MGITQGIWSHILVGVRDGILPCHITMGTAELVDIVWRDCLCTMCFHITGITADGIGIVCHIVDNIIIVEVTAGCQVSLLNTIYLFTAIADTNTSSHLSMSTAHVVNVYCLVGWCCGVGKVYAYTHRCVFGEGVTT